MPGDVVNMRRRYARAARCDDTQMLPMTAHSAPRECLGAIRDALLTRYRERRAADCRE